MPVISCASVGIRNSNTFYRTIRLYAVNNLRARTRKKRYNVPLSVSVVYGRAAVKTYPGFRSYYIRSETLVQFCRLLPANKYRSDIVRKRRNGACAVAAYRYGPVGFSG